MSLGRDLTTNKDGPLYDPEVYRTEENRFTKVGRRVRKPVEGAWDRVVEDRVTSDCAGGDEDGSFRRPETKGRGGGRVSQGGVRCPYGLTVYRRFSFHFFLPSCPPSLGLSFVSLLPQIHVIGLPTVQGQLFLKLTHTHTDTQHTHTSHTHHQIPLSLIFLIMFI